jgi:C1A family cysteine protease
MKCYRCTSTINPSQNNCGSCGQAVYTTRTSPGASMGRRLDGLLPGAISERDHTAALDVRTLPRQVDLRDNLGAVEDQGNASSCVANAAVGALEHQQRKAGKPVVELSRMFVYFNARRMSGDQNDDCGSSTAAGMAAFLAFGAPPETVWPYDLNLLTKEPSREVYEQAAANTPIEYARADGMQNIKGALASGFPVVMGVSIPQWCYQEAGKTGTMPHPPLAEIDKAKREMGHAMLLVGYDLDAGHFTVRNSWGQDWGHNGYFRMSFDTFEAATRAEASWILGNLAASPALTVQRPERKGAVDGSVRDMAAKMRHDIRDSLTKDIRDSFKDIKDRMKR